MQTRRASIKETGEELSQAEWERFDAAVAEDASRAKHPAPAAEVIPAAPDAHHSGAAKPERGTLPK